MGKEIKISEIPDDMRIEDLPEDTVLVLDDHEDAVGNDYWDDESD